MLLSNIEQLFSFQYSIIYLIKLIKYINKINKMRALAFRYLKQSLRPSIEKRKLFALAITLLSSPINDYRPNGDDSDD